MLKTYLYFLHSSILSVCLQWPGSVRPASLTGLEERCARPDPHNVHQHVAERQQEEGKARCYEDIRHRPANVRQIDSRSDKMAYMKEKCYSMLVPDEKVTRNIRKRPVD